MRKMILSMAILAPTIMVFSQEEPAPEMELSQAASEKSTEAADQEQPDVPAVDSPESVEAAVAQDAPIENEVAPEVEAPAEEAAQEQSSPAVEVPIMPTEPEIQEEVVTEVIEPAEELVGIDTVSLEDPQGNWLFKRIWWERAEDRYGKIRDLVNAIWESRTTFFMQRNELDKKVLDPFYLSIGMGQGELQTILSEMDEFFKKEQEKRGDLNEQERTLHETLTTEQESLQQLKTDVESISSLDQAVDDALG